MGGYTLHLSRLMKLLVSTTDDISLPFLIHMVTECVVIVDKVAINLLLEAKLWKKVVNLENLNHLLLRSDHRDRHVRRLQHLLVLKMVVHVILVIVAAVEGVEIVFANDEV